MAMWQKNRGMKWATGITLGDIEEFIARTLHSTGDAQGSDAHEQGANSQEGRAGLLPK